VVSTRLVHFFSLSQLLSTVLRSLSRQLTYSPSRIYDISFRFPMDAAKCSVTEQRTYRFLLTYFFEQNINSLKSPTSSNPNQHLHRQSPASSYPITRPKLKIEQRTKLVTASRTFPPLQPPIFPLHFPAPFSRLRVSRLARNPFLSLPPSLSILPFYHTAPAPKRTLPHHHIPC
jgi:hypothetical protein